MPLQEHDIPTVVMMNSLDSWEKDISSSVIYYNTYDGTEEVVTEFSLYEIGFSELIDIFLGIEVIGVEPSYINIINEVKTNLFKYIEEPIVTALLLAIKNETADDFIVTYFLSYTLEKAIKDTGVELKITMKNII